MKPWGVKVTASWPIYCTYTFTRNVIIWFYNNGVNNCIAKLTNQCSLKVNNQLPLYTLWPHYSDKEMIATTNWVPTTSKEMFKQQIILNFRIMHISGIMLLLVFPHDNHVKPTSLKKKKSYLSLGSNASPLGIVTFSLISTVLWLPSSLETSIDCRA